MLNISIVLDLANDYSVNAGVFRDSGNFVKEYANLCSATALYLLALQSEQLDRDQRQELITKCESYIKLQEEIELTRFSFEEAVASSPEKKKRKRIPTFKKAAETSFKTEQEYLDSPGFQQQQLLQHASIINDPSIVDEKDVILAAQETHEYYSESDDSVDFNPVQQKSKSAKKKTLPKKSKIKTEPKTPGGSDHPIENVQLVQVVQDPVVVSAPDHFGYCEVTPSEEVSDGFYNFSAAQLKAFSERFKGKICHGTMLSPKGNNLETIGVMGKCKDFLCPPEHFIREMFPNSFAGRLRAKALDPYGTMVAQIYGKRKDNGTEASWTCKNVNCHAKLILRTVKPDNEGNLYGLFGCFSHQHEMPREDRAQIVFKNRMECQEFYDKNLRMLYGKGQSKGQREKNNIYFPCRRRGLGATKDTRTTGIHDPNCGYIDCTSTFTMRTVFRGNPKDLESVPVEERPHCFSGIFFHNHENDERYHRLDNTDETNRLGAQRKWKRHKNSPTPKLKRQRKKRLELGIESNSKSKIRDRPKKNQTKGTSMSSNPHWLQVEMLETKEALETAETELGLESNIKVIKIRGRPKKKQ